MNDKEAVFSEEYRERGGEEEKPTAGARPPIDREYLDPEKPRLIVIRAKIVADEAEE